MESLIVFARVSVIFKTDFSVLWNEGERKTLNQASLSKKLGMKQLPKINHFMFAPGAMLRFTASLTYKYIITMICGARSTNNALVVNMREHQRCSNTTFFRTFHECRGEHFDL